MYVGVGREDNRDNIGRIFVKSTKSKKLMDLEKMYNGMD